MTSPSLGRREVRGFLGVPGTGYHLEAAWKPVEALLESRPHELLSARWLPASCRHAAVT